LRFGDQRAAALAGALCALLPAVTGFSSKTLIPLVAGHLGQPYSQSQMSYDLTRLRLHGLVQRLPHSKTYVLTGVGIRVDVFYTKLRRFNPSWTPTSPPGTRKAALKTLKSALHDYVHAARLAPAT
jgi:hypothetical protein